MGLFLLSPRSRAGECENSSTKEKSLQRFYTLTIEVLEDSIDLNLPPHSALGHFQMARSLDLAYQAWLDANNEETNSYFELEKCWTTLDVESIECANHILNFLVTASIFREDLIEMKVCFLSQQQGAIEHSNEILPFIELWIDQVPLLQQNVKQQQKFAQIRQRNELADSKWEKWKQKNNRNKTTYSCIVLVHNAKKALAQLKIEQIGQESQSYKAQYEEMINTLWSTLQDAGCDQSIEDIF